MKRQYIAPKSPIYKVSAIDFVLEEYQLATSGTDDAYSKDRGVFGSDKSDKSSEKEDYGFHRSMWD